MDKNNLHKKYICDAIDKKASKFIEISDLIWNNPELGFEEFNSTACLMKELRKEGFEIETGLAGIETAFAGTYGSGDPVIAILGEFDALPNLSQRKAYACKEEAVENGHGHGCGHNLIGSGSLAAAIAVKDCMKAFNLSGTIKYFGCPGEEKGCGKTLMAREGCFNSVDAALCWHPGNNNNVYTAGTLADLSAYFRFTGKSAHASVSPHSGRSALDAVELMNVGCNYLREHIIPEGKIHYAVTNTGGNAPNVVQEKAEVFYETRAPKIKDAEEILKRVCDVARGAAIMTGTSYEITRGPGMSDFIPNKVITKIMHRNLTEAGPPKFDENDYELAANFKKTFSTSDIERDAELLMISQGDTDYNKYMSKVLDDIVAPYAESDKYILASTDVGDVSYIVPTAQITAACSALGTQLHTWQMTSQSGSSIGHKGMLMAGKVLGMTAMELLSSPDLIYEAKMELLKKTNGNYTSPMADFKLQWKQKKSI